MRGRVCVWHCAPTHLTLLPCVVAGNNADLLASKGVSKRLHNIASCGPVIALSLPSKERDIVKLFRQLCPQDNGFVATAVVKVCGSLPRALASTLPRTLTGAFCCFARTG